MIEIYNRQIQFQKTMNTTYGVQYLALIAEVGELVDSFGFADWKEDVRDEDNILVECMDICIFAMNCNHYLEQEFIEPEKGQYIIDGDYELIDQLLDYVQAHEFIQAADLVFATYPEVKTRIIGKQALNRLRQDNGYKEGKYKKLWDGEEDNVYMLSIVKPDMSFDEIYENLDKKYKCLR